MELLWVRHAEPERIEAGLGVPANPALTALGHEQAARLAAWLAFEPIDAVVSSPQRRARETATPVARALGLEVEIVEGLVEYDVQSDHYIPTEELRAANDERWHAMVEGRWHVFGGEDPKVFQARVDAATTAIVENHPGRRVAAICHGGVINVALGAVLGMERLLWFDPMYTSISRMAASRNGIRSVLSLNERAHLHARREQE